MGVIWQVLYTRLGSASAWQDFGIDLAWLISTSKDFKDFKHLTVSKCHAIPKKGNPHLTNPHKSTNA